MGQSKDMALCSEDVVFTANDDDENSLGNCGDHGELTKWKH